MERLGTVTLLGERLILRRVKECDAESIYSGFVNQDEFLYYAFKNKVTLEEQIEKTKKMVSLYSDNDYYNWAIVTKQDEFLGMVNLKVNDKNDSVEFSYAIDNRHTGKGYMTEALKLVLDFALNKMKVARIQGACVTENIASKKVMEKCGMENEGVLKNYIKLSDGSHDAYMFSCVNK